MSNIAIVKVIKDLFEKFHGYKEHREEETPLQSAETLSSSNDTVPEEASSNTEEKEVKKKTAKTEKAATKKKKTSSSKTAKTTAKGSKKAEKIALYSKALKKHYGEVDEQFLEIIVKNLGPSIYRKDAELVSCSDPKELDTVRKNFLMKKLGLEEEKETLDAAIKEVCEELKESSKKYRALFYYRLAQKFKKESVLS